MSWESFRSSVLECLSKINIARGYTLGYHHQALETEDGREEVKSHKIYRSHRDAALTCDGEFISQVMQ
jgi:hypothetical protein